MAALMTPHSAGPKWAVAACGRLMLAALSVSRVVLREVEETNLSALAEKGLSVHVGRAHGGAKKMATGAVEVGKNVCGVCAKTFTTARGLSRLADAVQMSTSRWSARTAARPSPGRTA